MKLSSYIIAIAAIMLPSTIASALNKQTTLYVYGIATSFNDSTVYFTELQQMTDTWVDTKTEFLYSRDNYSYQLRDYLKQKGVAHPTCVTIFGKTRKEAEKKYVELKKRYITKGRYDIKYVTLHDFAYSAITPDESEQKTDLPRKTKAKSNKKDK